MERVQKECRILELHAELFALILSKLPVQKIFQLQCVCKTWKAFLTKDHFQYSFRALSQTPMYTVPLDNGFAAYSFETKSWHRWTSALHSRYFSRYNVHGEFGDWLLVEDPKIVREDGLPSLYLANPRKRFRRKLPNLPKENWDPSVAEGHYLAVGLIPGESSKSYKVFILNIENADPWDADFSGVYKVYWYDSQLDSWKAIRLCQEEYREKISDITFHEGALHCIILERDEEYRFVRRKVCRYDERKSCWQALSAQITEKLRFERLYEWHGHLILIGGRRGGHHNESRLASIHIWQLDKENHVWVETGRMPDHILDHFYSSEMYLHSRAVVLSKMCGHHIILANVAYDTEYKHKERHVMYDLSTTLWWAVPELPFSSKCSGSYCLISNSRSF